jgi:hypothetical protein
VVDEAGTPAGRLSAMISVAGPATPLLGMLRGTVLELGPGRRVAGTSAARPRRGRLRSSPM